MEHPENRDGIFGGMIDNGVWCFANHQFPGLVDTARFPQEGLGRQEIDALQDPLGQFLRRSRVILLNIGPQVFQIGQGVPFPPYPHGGLLLSSSVPHEESHFAT